MAEQFESVKQRIDAISGELTRRIAQVRNRSRRTNIIAGLLAMFIVGYMVWTAQYISRYLTPDNMATSVYGRIVQQLPSASEEAAHSLQESAPELVAETLRGIAVSIPQLRKSAQNQFNLLLEEGFAEVGRHLESTVPRVFVNHPDLLARLAQPMTDEEIRSVASTLASTLEIAIEAEGLDVDALKQIRDKMWAVHEELDTLRRGDKKLTETQQLEKRFIELAIKLIHREAS